MKKILIFNIISLLLFGIPAFAGDVDLSGCWEVEIGGIDSKGQKIEENNHIWIVQEEDNFFSGWVCNDPDPAEEGMHFSGAIDGREIYITHWDSFTKATLNGRGDVISGVNQGQDIDKRVGKTSFATAIRVDNDECSPCEPYNPDTAPSLTEATATRINSNTLEIQVNGSDVDANALGIYITLFSGLQCGGGSLTYVEQNFSPSLIGQEIFSATVTITSTFAASTESLIMQIVDATGLLSDTLCIDVE
ncbi:hypothetical protein DSCW_64570 [Desulfosarcina widdelii]|uniref:Uncharacterized protein n=1 Tax=Desulfosarcina widdelii TaxID=947919 RepID=A0A5K7ZDY8_9BACT|nr:hypothetical protein [Desulfosarcina widdelii]BBO79040.1 hypothetical protein DSCW_64570 [Desulfosarcina widdelii]